MNGLIPSERIEKRILLLRGQKVIMSTDLAELYEVEPRILVQAVKRNSMRSPAVRDNAEGLGYTRWRSPVLLRVWKRRRKFWTPVNALALCAAIASAEPLGKVIFAASTSTSRSSASPATMSFTTRMRWARRSR